jgi:hypothetical protein
MKTKTLTPLFYPKNKDKNVYMEEKLYVCTYSDDILIHNTSSDKENARKTMAQRQETVGHLKKKSNNNEKRNDKD